MGNFGSQLFLSFYVTSDWHDVEISSRQRPDHLLQHSLFFLSLAIVLNCGCVFGAVLMLQNGFGTDLTPPWWLCVKDKNLNISTVPKTFLHITVSHLQWTTFVSPTDGWGFVIGGTWKHYGSYVYTMLFECLKWEANIDGDWRLLAKALF